MMIKTVSEIKPPVGVRLNPAHGLARGLTACWLLNEGAGRSTHDATGHHHDGSFSGAPLWAPGRFGDAVEFGGYDDWISMGDCLDLGTDDVTLFAIIKYSAVVQPDEWSGLHFGAIAGKGHLDGSGRGYGLSVNSNNQIHWQVRNQSNNLSVSSDIALNDGQYHLAIGVCDRDDVAGMRLYVDGVQQTAIADPTPINGSDLSGSRFFAVGSRQEETGGIWFWDFHGSIVAVYVWKRVLTEVEILQLQRNPFAPFSCRQATALLMLLADVFVGCAGSITEQSRASAKARVTRHFTSIVRTGTSVSAMLPVISSLSGTIDGLEILQGTLTTSIPRAVFGGILENESCWLREALFNGMTSAAFKLGTALIGGWFWTRRHGCTVVYCGVPITQVDLGSILYVTDITTTGFSLPAYLSHVSGWTYCYLVRRFNGCGYQEQTTHAAVVVRIAPDGALDQSAPNAIVALSGEQTASKLRLAWFYCPLDQRAAPESFNIYWDNGSGRIDYENPVAVIPYRARKFYCYRSGTLVVGRYTFATRVESAAHIEGNTSPEITCQVNNRLPEPPLILVAEAT